MTEQPGLVDQNLFARVAQILQQFKGAAVPAGAQLAPGIGVNQATPPNVAAPVPGQQMGGVPSANVATGVPVATPERQQSPNPYVPLPKPQLTDVAFPDAKAARTASVHDFISHVTGLVNTIKQQKQQKLERQAKILFDSLHDAIGRGDRELIARLLDETTPEGKKNVAMLEKSGLGVPPEIETKKQKPATPEQIGLQKTIAEIGAKPSAAEAATQQAQVAAAQASTAQSQTAQYTAEQVMERMKADPAFANKIMTGSAMAPSRQAEAEEVGVFTPSPDIVAQMSQREQESIRTMNQGWAQLHNMFEIESKKLNLMEIANELTAEASVFEAEARVEEAKARRADAAEMRKLQLARIEQWGAYNVERQKTLAGMQTAKNKDGYFKMYTELAALDERRLASMDDVLSVLQREYARDPSDEMAEKIAAYEASMVEARRTLDMQKNMIRYMDAEGIGDALLGTPAEE